MKPLDVIVYVPASLDCSCPLDTRCPEELTCTLEEKGGVTWYSENETGRIFTVVGSLELNTNDRDPLTIVKLK